MQKVREAAARSTCSNNMKQMGLAIHNYESAYGSMPSVGQCESSTGSVTYTVHGWSVLILPYIEQENVYRLLDTNYNHFADSAYRNASLHAKSRGRAYDDPAFPSGMTAAATKIKTYVCPSTPIGNDQRDTASAAQGGIAAGGIDYMAIALTDIEYRTNGPVPQGTRNSVDLTLRTLGAMTCDGRRVANITDGSSSTILLIEDAGRAHPLTGGLYGAAASNGRLSAMNSPAVPMTSPASAARRVFAWIDADAATNGVSGPNNATGNKTAKINNHNTPTGGPTSGSDICAWSTNNCGPNDEPFSFHSGGAMSVMADGSVRFLRDSTDALTLRWLSGADDGQVISNLD